MGLLGISNNYSIRPTQNYLNSETIEFYKNNPQLSIPIPVGKEIIYDNYDYFVIDGHHNLCYQILSNQKPLLWVAENGKDYIPLDMFPDDYRKFIKRCNEMIRKRYEFAQFYMPSNNSGQEIKTLVDLLKEIKSKKE